MKLDPSSSIVLQLSSDKETHDLGRELAASLCSGAVIALYGDLGAGKTTLTRGLAEGLGYDSQTISSPTFQFLHVYEGAIPLYHFDLYRLPSQEEFLLAGFDEYLDGQGISCIEWAEKITPLLPPSAWKLTLSYSSQNSRTILIERGCT